MTNPLVELQTHGQSIWYDNIRRALIDTGDIARKIEQDDLRGVTSNPSIFEKAIAGSTDYDTAMRQLVAEGRDLNAIYDALVIEDIQRTADLFRPVYDRTNRVDGYVSLEVSPLLADDTASTVAEAKRLWAALDRANVMIKIPATEAGLPAITEVIASGINVNVTLIFSEEVYAAVADAYISGLEQRAAAGLPVDHIASVASVFVSRIDSAVDNQLSFRIRRLEDETEKQKLSALLGKAAIANTKLIYQRFKQLFNDERFAALKAKGAQAQRPLWASTGTKNPTYKDTLYVEELIGPHTVDTVPPATYTAFRDHGAVRLSLEEDVDGAHATIAQLTDAGVDLAAIMRQLRDEGVQAFIDSFKSLMDSIAAKQAAITSGLLDRQSASLGANADAFNATLARMEKEDWMRRIWRKDAALWKSDGDHQKIIRNALGWVAVVDLLEANADELAAFSQRIRDDGFTDVMLLGMGGSSLCPEVFRRTFGKVEGFPTLHVLDSTDPATVKSFEARVDLAKTLFIVASKSGSTTEPLMFYRYFFERLREIKSDRAGDNFIAITDPGTLMEAMATGDRFRRIFLNPSDIGGRYSALSFFGMVPACLQGFDFKTLLDRSARAMHACSPAVPTADNPAARLGALIGTMANAGRDKLTLITSSEISSLGLWIEQLLAESTGKEGRGVIPVSGEPLAAPSVYGNDRLFVSISVGDADSDTENRLAALEAAGHPVVRRRLTSTLDLGEEFYIWELATAVAGAVIGINPFDQPNVQESKDNTKRVLEGYKRLGGLPAPSVAVENNDLSVWGDSHTVYDLDASSLADFIIAHLKRAGSGDYIALLAYIQETAEHDQLLQALRTHLRDALGVATTVGYGPRFLHSTGQLHKGGPNSGVFVQLTAERADGSVKIPGEPFTFGVLKLAQAIGDYLALENHQRRAINVHLRADTTTSLRALLEIVQNGLPLTQGQAK
jgi:transaldolase/glucose-6-phosphate isomerase